MGVSNTITDALATVNNVLTDTFFETTPEIVLLIASETADEFDETLTILSGAFFDTETLILDIADYTSDMKTDVQTSTHLRIDDNYYRKVENPKEVKGSVFSWQIQYEQFERRGQFKSLY